jgi:hypothetical protein
MYYLTEDDDDRWKNETCWRCNASIIKLSIDIENLVGYYTRVSSLIIYMHSNYIQLALLYKA